MMNLNGNIYTAKDTAPGETLCNTVGTCYGFYKRYKNRIEFFDVQGCLFAALVRFNRSEHFGFVNAIEVDRKKYYQHSASQRAKELLGVPGSYLAERDYAKETFHFLASPASAGS